MSQKQSSPKSELLTDLSPYIYGTTRLGDEKIPFEERVKVARAAMDATDWFHTSHTYGNALQVLRAAFDEDQARLPKLIVKIGWSHAAELRRVIYQNLDPLRLNGLELGQLCLSGELAKEYANGGECYKVFSQLKQEGLVEAFRARSLPMDVRPGAPGAARRLPGRHRGWLHLLPESPPAFCLERIMGDAGRTG